MDCRRHFPYAWGLRRPHKLRTPQTLAHRGRRSNIYLGLTFLSLACAGAPTLGLRHFKNFFPTGFNF